MSESPTSHLPPPLPSRASRPPWAHVLHAVAWLAFLSQIPFLALKSSLTWYAWVWLWGAVVCLASIPTIRFTKRQTVKATLHWALAPALWGSRISIAVVIGVLGIALLERLAK
jgi:hypothetical protein